MDTIPCRELETEGDLINLPLDGKETNIAGTQVVTPQGEADIEELEESLPDMGYKL